MIRVAVLGAAGRMGIAVCTAISSAPDLELVAAVDPAAAGRPFGEVTGLDAGPSEISGSVDSLTKAGAEVAVDFTVATAARANLKFCADNGVHAVCGTTGFTKGDLEQLRVWFSGDAHIVVAPNFSIGAALMMRCGELCAPFIQAAEVIELHHDKKRDAPSGTSMETIRRIQKSRGMSKAGEWSPDPTETEVLPGARGAVAEGGIHLHSVRLPGLLAHQEMIFGLQGETLSIRHDSFDRASFMPGVLLAVRRVSELAGLTIGLGELLGF